MPSLTILPSAKGAWPDLKGMDTVGRVVHHTGEIQIAPMEGAMEGGKDSVCIRVDLEDKHGTIVIIETSMDLFLMAARAMSAQQEKAKANGAIHTIVRTTPDIILPGQGLNN